MNASTNRASGLLESRPDGLFRLKPQSSVGGGFLFILVFAILWNLATWGFLAILYSPTNSHPVPWYIGAALVIVGLIFIAVAIKRFLRLTMVGQTTVEVSTPVAYLGEALDVVVRQPGQFTIERCNVELICRETATFSAGTDTQTHNEVVRTIPICELNSVSTRQGDVLTRQSVMVPADAMITFEAPSNKIHWCIRVSLTVPKRPDSDSFFPIRLTSRQIMEAEGSQNAGS